MSGSSIQSQRRVLAMEIFKLTYSLIVPRMTEDEFNYTYSLELKRRKQLFGAALIARLSSTDYT